jgi:hypothetical protein
VPNGDYSLTFEDWETIKAFFEELSPVLSSFAAAHDLAIDKYYHDFPSWTFRFRHPKGGGAGIEVRRLDEAKIQINTLWHLDEYETFTHNVKSVVGSDLSWRTTNVIEILEQSLREILTWDKSSLTAHRGYEKFWSRYTKEEFEEMSDGRLPELKL